MTTIKRILVPTDFSEPATHALQYASALAKRVGASLTVMYADTFLPPVEYTSGLAIWADSTVPLLEERARKQMAEDIKKHVDPDVRAEAIVHIATPAEGILEQVKSLPADLIVMGTHGRTGLRRLVFGSVTEAVMRRASVPVLAIPANCAVTAPMNAIVCPAEDNARGAEGLRLAAALAPPDARFFVIGAVAEDTIDSDDEIADLDALTPQELRGRSKSMVVSAGHMADKISRLALNLHSDLIVATEPATRGTTEVMSGTFAEKLLRHHTCPILTLNARMPVGGPAVTLEPVKMARAEAASSR
jgi:nucleotide-binding universal stress UspA family protein